MTRWVRAGNSQRHKKMPGDATKWGEFDHQKANKSFAKKRKLKNEPNIIQNEKSCSSINISAGKVLDSNEEYEQPCKHQKINSFDTKDSQKSVALENLTDNTCDRIHSNELPSNLKPDFMVNVTQENINSEQKSLLQKDVSVKKLKNKKKAVKGNDAKSASDSDVSDKSPEVSPTKAFDKKKSMYLEKLKKKRAENGITLLPSKVERKLYYIKKKLREKGFPSAMIKDIIRKERRKEELKFRKNFNPSKLCFKCRQPGHILADCPVKLGSSNQETGICFKCGSAEHTSFKCPEKVQGFPFAKCFICKEQGHISKDCPRNKHGVYPKGGRCNLCGNVNHLRKDCPSLSKKEDNESTITLHTIDEVTSIDEEVLNKRDVKQKKRDVKKPKLVKF